MLTLVLTMICAGQSAATPWGWQGVGEVKVIGGRPAICIPGSAKRDFPVQSVWLVHENRPGQELAWHLKVSTPSRRVVLKPGQCLRYGVDLAGYAEEIAPVALTEAGRYTFRLNGVAVRRTDPAAYWGSFCLRSGANGC